MSSPVAVHSVAVGWTQRFGTYWALTKPRIIELLLITTVPAMVLAARGWPGTWLVLSTLIGGTLSAGGANALNCYIDRDIDEVMRRTSRRPLPRHQIEPVDARNFGIALGLAGFAWLWAFTNLTAALLATAALLFYVFVYTLWLKRTTPQNIVIGGAAGAVPALVGWAAVTGGVGLAAWILFAVVFYWTPPHFWALALRYRDEYAAAAVPMLPCRGLGPFDHPPDGDLRRTDRTYLHPFGPRGRARLDLSAVCGGAERLVPLAHLPGAPRSFSGDGPLHGFHQVPRFAVLGSDGRCPGLMA